MSLQPALIPPEPGEVEERLARALAELDRERKAVGEIQRSLLPASLPEIPGFELSPYYRPSDHASGDYYDVLPLVDDQWGILMADVAGHGTPAAVIMAVMRTLIHAELPHNRGMPPGEFLERMNEVMSETYLQSGLFVTVWAALLNPVSRRLTYACAGHNAPRLLRGGRVLELNAVGGFPLGLTPSSTYEDADITLEAGDLLVVYTDGITEARRPGVDGRELFGTERFDRVLSECESEGASGCASRVTRALAAFTQGTPPTDDQAMLVVRAKGVAANVSR